MLVIQWHFARPKVGALAQNAHAENWPGAGSWETSASHPLNVLSAQGDDTYTYHLFGYALFTVATRKPSRRTNALPIDAPERRRLPPLLRRAWYSLNQAFRRRLAHLGLTPDQFTVLRTLLEAHERGVTQREVTEAMSSDPNTVASLVERMEQSGLLDRQPHENDRRAHRLQLQPAGRERYEQARLVAIRLQTEILAVLPEGKREEFFEHLALVADACRTAAETSPKRGKK